MISKEISNMLMKTEYLKMKCKTCGYEEWVDADIADELASYNQKTRTHEILLDCPKCNKVMIWHHRETKVEQWESLIDIDNLPF